MIVIHGGKKVTLSQNDFISQGGEGKVFGKGGIIYKIYDDPIKKMIPLKKIEELKKLNRDNILNPLDVVMDVKNVNIGFTMKWIKKTIPLCKLFSNSFRNDNLITNEIIIEIVQLLKETTHFIHSNGCLVVDGNEFNYLVSTDFKIPFFIDVDSYQTKTFPATAIMPSIRDWSNPHSFSELTDWYSFAIIAFQLFIGIHPYKGKHPEYKKVDIKTRCEKKISIFNPNVTIPPTVRDFDNIPSYYMDWFIDLFEKGKRTPPPSETGLVKAVKTKIITITSSNNFEITLIQEFEGNITSHKIVYGREITKTAEYIYLNDTKYKITPNVDVIYSDNNFIPIFVKIEEGELKLKPVGANLNGKALIASEEKTIVGNVLYVKNEEKLIEMKTFDNEKGVTISHSKIWSIMPNSSEIFDGVIYQNILGRSYLTILLPEISGFMNIDIPELSGYKVLDAKYDNMVCVLYAHKGSVYSRFVFKFSKTFTYSCRETKDVDFSNVNFVSLETGICVLITDEGIMELFSIDPLSQTVKTIKDSQIDSDMILCKKGTSLRFFKGNKLYDIKMKQ